MSNLFECASVNAPNRRHNGKVDQKTRPNYTVSIRKPIFNIKIPRD